MLIRLHDRELLPRGQDAGTGDEWPALSNEVVFEHDKTGFRWSDFEVIPPKETNGRMWQNLVKEEKAAVTAWRRRGEEKPSLFELTSSLVQCFRRKSYKFSGTS